MSFLLSPQHIGRAGSSFELECSGGGQENFYSVGGVNYKSCTFLTTGTLTASNEGLVDVMVVSGGGGGNPTTSSPEGGFFGGGGGAGGMVVQTGLTISEGSGTVIVTAGSATGVNGQSSVIPSNIITSGLSFKSYQYFLLNLSSIALLISNLFFQPCLGIFFNSKTFQKKFSNIWLVSHTLFKRQP